VSEQERRTRQGAEYENVGQDYMEHRQLRKGAAGWVLLAGLGIAYVISGDAAGWHFGLGVGGWGGLLIATLLMATMYTAMVFALAELSAAIPTAGGGYAFARRAMGPWGGFLTGTAILIEYTLAPAVVATFIGGYMDTLIGVGGPIVYLVCYLVFVGIHLYGVGEALKVMFAITVVAVVAIAAFVIGMIPQFEVANLFNIDPTNAAGASAFLPFGMVGIWAAFPFAIWFFLAIEGVPLAAEETRDPARDMPKGLIAGMAALLLFAILILVFGPGGAGSAVFTSDEMLAAPSVLPLALEEAYGGTNALSTFVNIAGLAALIASFFSIIFAYSRQLFALSRAGYLPRFLSVTGGRSDPAQQRSLRRGDLLRPDDALAHRAAPARAGSGSPLPHAGRRHNLGRSVRAGGSCGHRDIYCGRQGGAHNARRLRALYRVLRPLQPPPPRGTGT
jgi:ethanolamine permease